jgi:Ca2+-binding EF-hand superfamily protein
VSRDLPKILSVVGVFMNRTEFAELVRHFDTFGTGEVSLTDFLAFIAPPLSRHRGTWVSKAFSEHDRGGNSSLELSKIYRLNSIQGSVIARVVAAQPSPDILVHNLVRYSQQNGASSIPKTKSPTTVGWGAPGSSATGGSWQP